jgi:mannosyltransferase OCH1-like enzyme
MIPVFIHQTWKDNAVPRDVYPQEWQDSWQLKHPGCIYKLWTDEDLTMTARVHFRELQAVFEDGSTPGVVKADFGRLMSVYRYGGIYADLDYRCLKDLRPLLSRDYTFVASAAEGEPNYIHNAFFAARPRHPLLVEIMLEGLKNWRKDKKQKPEDIAGPNVFGPAVWRYKQLSEEADRKVWVAPPDLLCPHPWTHTTAKKNNLPKEVLEQPEKCYPDAYAITYWVHGW